MSYYFKDYYWKNLKPVGITPSNKEVATYKIVEDPYKRWQTIEKYEDGIFISLVYDSQLLDARHFDERELPSWEKILWKEDSFAIYYLYIRRDEKLACYEKFLKDTPGICEIFSPSGTLCFTQKTYYKSDGAPFDGISLEDSMGKKVFERAFSLKGDLFEETLYSKKDFLPQQLTHTQTT